MNEIFISERICYQQHEVVPDTPLVTSKVLSEETDHWLEVKQGLALALQEMRVNQETVTLKNPKNSVSALVRKRMAAKEREMKAPTPIVEEKDTDSQRASPAKQMSVENTQM